MSADKEAITDALVNLVDNAMKYSTDAKEIVIRTGKSERYVWVEVEDHGIGISEKNQKYIFDKFYRVTETNLANKVKGSGLGLAIVKHIVDAHNGMINVQSTPGTGSRFRLSFPFK
jgi:two-component system phosphate regulon sensor histidine kinase PhoR